MADHAKPILTDNYTDVLSQIRGRLEDQARGFDPANTIATNITTGTIRWNSAENKDQKWTGTAWVDKSSNYVFNGITLSGGTANGVAYLNGSKVLTTGGALTFDGTTLGSSGNTNGANIEVLKLSNIGSGDNTQASVGFYAAGTKYSEIIGGYSGAPSLKYNVTTTIGYHQWQINNSEQMRLTSTGLGIGTSSPGYKLDVRGTGSQTVAVRTQTSGDPIVYLEAGGANAGFVQYSRSAQALQLSGQNPTVHATLDSSGNLGIGTSSPATKLAINGTPGATYADLLRLDISSAGPVNISFGDSGTSAARPTVGGNGNSLVFGTGAATKMTLDANGKLILSAANQGIQFADGTTQTTAGVNPATASAGAVGTYAMLKFVGSGSVLDGSTVSGTNLRYTNAAGTTTESGGFPTGTWKAMGFVQTTSDATRTTLWLRIS